jgi:hypothetical protein
MKTKILFLLLFTPAFLQAKTNVDSLKRATLQPVINDYVLQAIVLVYDIQTTPDVNLIREYVNQLTSLSNGLKKTIGVFYPHGNSDMSSSVDHKHMWESYADSILEKVNDIYYLCDRSPVKMQKKVDAIVEQLREMESM